MWAKRHYKSRHSGNNLIMVIFLAAVFCCSCAIGAEPAKKARQRYMSRSLKHMAADDAKTIIEDVQLGTVSKLPNSNTVLVTGTPDQIRKASAILKVMDAAEPYLFQPFGDAAEANELPDTAKIEKNVEGITIGTFLSPPVGIDVAKVIIDIHDDSLYMAAPEKMFGRIIAAIQDIKAGIEEQEVEQAVEAVEPEPVIEEVPLEVVEVNEITEVAAKAEVSEDELFGNLLETLEAAEKKMAEAEVKKPAEPVAERKIERIAEKIEKVEPTVAPVAEPVVAVEVEVAKEPEKCEPEAVEGDKYYQKLYRPEPLELGNEELDLDLPEKLEIGDLLRLVGEYLQLDYLYDPVKVKGAVTLKLRGPIKVRDLYPLLESVLKFQGFVMTRKDNLVTIRPAAEVLDIDPALVKDDDGKVKVGDVIITRLFNLNYADPTSAKNLLDQMKLGINVTPITDTGTLIVTGYAYRMPRIEELLKMIDLPGEPKKFRYRQLQYTMAGTLAPQIKTLVEQMGEISITVAAPAAAPAPAPSRTSRTRTPAPKPTPTPTAAAPVKDGVYLDADERTNRILMIGRESDLNMVNELIDSLDVEQQDLRQLRAYEIQYVGAEEVREKLAELGIVSETGVKPTTGTRRTPTPAAKPGTPAATATTAEEPLVEEPQVVVVESTNTLLVNASAEQHAQISLIIGYVDSETERAAIPYVIYPLENQDPEVLAATLQQLIQETVESKTTDKDAKITTTTQKIGKFEDDITVVPDVDTYSLIVYASKKNQQWVSALIEELDEYRPLVLLDCTLVEVSKNDSFEYDLDIIAKTYGGSQTMDGGVGKLADFQKGVDADARSDGGIGKAFYNSNKIQAFLDVVEKKSYGRIMAKPKILVNDNQEGEIKTETTTSVAQVKSQTQVPEQGAPITTTDVSFNEYKEGVTLSIKPHISKGDMLRLEITLNRTDFDPQDDVIITEGGVQQTYPSPPDLLSTDITTVSTVPDGSTIILGGLESVDQKKSNTKVPILGDIPLVGGLFRGINNTGEQNKLYIFVRASIIRPGDQVEGMEDIRDVSGRNRRAFEKLEKEFQEARSWPGIKAESMSPLKVLEED